MGGEQSGEEREFRPSVDLRELQGEADPPEAQGRETAFHLEAKPIDEGLEALAWICTLDLEDPKRVAFEAQLDALPKRNPQKALEFYRAGSRYPNPLVRHAIAEGLGDFAEVNQEEALMLWVRLRGDSDPDVAGMASDVSSYLIHSESLRKEFVQEFLTRVGELFDRLERERDEE